MKKLAIKRRIIMIILTALLSFIMLFFSIKYNWNFSYILKDIFYFPIHAIPSNNEKKVFSKIENELEQELKDMKELLKIDNTLTEFDIVNATVINRNTSYWNSEIIINKGTKDNLNEGMAVIDGYGLVGRIEKPGLTTSVVKLITSNLNNNKISVKLWSNNNSINKILEQDDNNNLIISGIDNNYVFNIGDIVTTSGLSDIYPSGITIGKVSKIESDKFGLSKKAYITRTSDLDDIRFVSVLIRKTK